MHFGLDLVTFCHHAYKWLSHNTQRPTKHPLAKQTSYSIIFVLSCFTNRTYLIKFIPHFVKNNTNSFA